MSVTSLCRWGSYTKVGPSAVLITPEVGLCMHEASLTVLLNCVRSEHGLFCPTYGISGYSGGSLRILFLVVEVYS
jgi:hypothetical protein